MSALVSPLFLSTVPAKAELQVAIASGKLQGALTSSGAAVFKGIPFAQPPTSELRWREPRPAKAWSGVRDATVFGSPCLQGGASGAKSSEDCLYLNVWTPEWPVKSPKAVMVWIHGGGNFAGSGSDPTFDGESLVRHGVLLVTLNYRLGVFGFFAHPELSKQSPHHVSGNYGLLDQIQALRWVHENIAKFGGDPRNVTVFGESAGSLDINVLMTSPLSKGLFQRVVGESGPVVAPPTLAEGEKKGEGIAGRLNVGGENVIEKLRALTAADIQKNAGQGLALLGPTLGVVVDGWLFPQSPMKVFASGKEQRVGLLLGNNSQELQKPFFPMTGSLRKAIEEQYGLLAARALKAYGVNGDTEPEPDPQFGPILAQWATDSQFRCGTVAELVWHTEAGNSGYQFQFSWPAKGKETLGAAHGSEVPYVFGTLNSPKYNAADRQISAAMQAYWTNFAKTGDPNARSLPRWSKFDEERRAYIDFVSSGPVAKQGLRRQVCEIYTENLKRLFSE
ncbi:MAG: carboxylesterase/lipase family protein [Bryobacteraceae bacterium]